MTTPRRDLHLLVGEHARYAFAGPPHPGVVVHRAGSAEIPSPDILLLPCGTKRAIIYTDELLAALPQAILDRARAGRIGVVFDGSTEGYPHEPNITRRLHRWLAQLGAPVHRAAYLTQDSAYEADYRAYCAEAGLKPMAVINHDYWFWAFSDQFHDNGADVFEARLAAFRTRSARRERRFVSLNYTPRPTKLLFLLSLIRDGLWDEGFISFGGLPEKRKTVGAGGAEMIRRMAELPGFADLTEALKADLPRLQAYGRVVLGPEEPDGNRPLADPTLHEYEASWFSVITETEMMDRPCRITEKPLKSLVNFQPFITFGNPQALKAVEALGFVTFPEIVDQAYDDEPSPRRRFDLAYAQVRRLCALDEGELARLEASIADRLTHNARWGLIHMPGEVRRRAHERLRDALEEAIL